MEELLKAIHTYPTEFWTLALVVIVAIGAARS